MDSFYLTLIAVMLAGLGARDQVLVANLASRQGKRSGVLLAGLLVSVLTAGFAAWAATAVIPLLAADARAFLAGVALAFSGGESLLVVPRRKLEEPTRSLGACAIVLLSQQLTDAARFLVFAVAIGTNAPLTAGVGGALGGMVVIAAAWSLPEVVLHPRARLVRRLVGGLLLIVGAIVALQAIGRL